MTRLYKRIGVVFVLIFFGLNIQQAYGRADTILVWENFIDTPLKEVFSILEDKYRIKLAYDVQITTGIVINRRIDGLEPGPALDRILSGTALTYQFIDDHHALIREKDGLSQKQNPFPSGNALACRGTVLDGLTGQPLPMATIYIPELGKGAISDETGAFSLSFHPAPSTPLDVRVQYLGYNSQLTKLQPGPSPVILRVKLFPKSHEIPGIIVKERVPLLSQDPSSGKSSLYASQLDALPAFAAGQDLFRNLQLLPGISAHDDLSAGLHIRGSGSDENLIILDGITLYHIDHFFGIFSAINPDVIGKVTLYKNEFPIEYGGRTSGVVDMTTKPAGTKRISGGAELNLLTANAHLETTIAPKLGLLLGGRITTKNLIQTDIFNTFESNQPPPPTERPRTTLTRQQVLSLTPDFRFYDLNGKLHWQPATHTSLSLHYFRGFDAYQYDYQQQFSNRFLGGLIQNTESYREDVDWINEGVALRLDHQWNDRIRSSVNLSYSGFRNTFDIRSYLARERRDNTDTLFFDNAQYNEIDGFELNWKNDWSVSPKQHLTFGFQSTRNTVDYQFTLDNRPLLEGNSTGLQNAAYTQWRAGWGQRWETSAGLRLTHFDISRSWYASPRFQINYALQDHWKLKASWSRYFQFLRQANHEDRFGRAYTFWVMADDGRFPVLSADHLAFGGNFSRGDFAVDVEFFQKNTSGVIEYASLKTGFDLLDEGPSRNLKYLLFQGDGHSYGVDVLLQKISGSYTGWIAYTWSKSTNSFPQIQNGEPFPSQDDRRHQIKWINQYRLKNWDFSATYIFSSGRPYTDLSVVAQRNPNSERPQLSIDDRIQRLEDYQRIDLGATCRFQLLGTTIKAGASVFNLFDWENVKYRQYIYAIQESAQLMQPPTSAVVGSELQMLGRTFNLSLNATF